MARRVHLEGVDGGAPMDCLALGDLAVEEMSRAPPDRAECTTPACRRDSLAEGRRSGIDQGCDELPMTIAFKNSERHSRREAFRQTRRRTQ